MARGSKAPKISGRRGLTAVEPPKQGTGMVLAQGDPAIGRECTSCGKRMRQGEQVSASGLRHLDCKTEPVPPAPPDAPA